MSKVTLNPLKKNSSNQMGFTLIELLLYLTIATTLLGGVTAFLSMSLNSRIKTQSIAEVNQQGTAMLERFTTIVRGADSITSPAAGASASSLTLAMTTPAINPTIFDASASSPATMQIKESTGAAVPLTNNKVTVSNLTFKNLSKSSTPGVVQISFTLTRVNTSGRNEYTYQKTFTTSVALR